MFYLITPPSRTKWCVPRAELIEMLEREWPGVTITISGADAPRARDVVWELSIDGARLDGSQDRAGQAHYLDGSVEAIATFAAWWKTQVAQEQPLILCDEGYTTVVDLAPGIDAGDIVDALR